jgi:riboflavin synthase
MFTGIVQATGEIVASDRRGDGIRMRVDGRALGAEDIAIGESVAVSGCCLTVVARDGVLLDFDVSAETLRCVAGFHAGGRVNLERSLRLADRLGGHLVSGHVDGVGTVATFAPVGDAGGSFQLAIDAPAALARYVATKGSIAVDGVSLTTNAVEGARFTVNVIPHTLAVTTLALLTPGARVNLEVDLLARYVERIIADSRRGS